MNYTLAEAATKLRVSVRSMRDIAVRHPYYYAVGNRKLFTENDLEKIVEGLRGEAAARLGAGSQGAQLPTVSATKAMDKVMKLLERGKRTS